MDASANAASPATSTRALVLLRSGHRRRPPSTLPGEVRGGVADATSCGASSGTLLRTSPDESGSGHGPNALSRLDNVRRLSGSGHGPDAALRLSSLRRPRELPGELRRDGADFFLDAGCGDPAGDASGFLRLGRGALRRRLAARFFVRPGLASTGSG